jgi:hydroxyacyl-ACP dehydratase HTD2-like protein with hotdog domain
MTSQLYFDDVEIGNQVPAGEAVIDPRQLFFFSAATYNGHRIHYDAEWARTVEGYPGIIVHGPLQSAIMARTLTDWAGPRGRLVRIAVSHRASALPGQHLRFEATVTGKREAYGACLVDLEIWETNDAGERLMPGSATVSLPRSADQ